MAPNSGTIYLCSTPIGNLEDVTQRVLRILREVACIAAEDTRHTQKLLRHYDIPTRLTSLHEHNEAAKSASLIELALNGEDVAVVSDAGTPALSDPGYQLVQAALQAGVAVRAVPGPSALLAALVVSGLPPHPFYFGGFLPRREGQRREVLRSLSTLDATLAFYEVPHRLLKSLEGIATELGDRRVVLARELTKLHEEVLSGSARQLKRRLEDAPPRGEFVVLIEGRPAEAGDLPTIGDEQIRAALAASMETGKTKKEAIKDVASFLGVHRNVVYKAAISLAASEKTD